MMALDSYPSTNLSSQFALDVQSVQKLKYSAANSHQGSLKEAARQFEAVFLQMMLKSMRDALPKSGLLESQQMDMMTSMQDQQWSQQLAGHGFGLADQLVKQLEGSGLPGTQGMAASDRDDSALIAGIPHGTPRPLTGGLRMPAEPASTAEGFGDRPAHVAEFLARLAEPAKRAERASGVPAELILAQAALETGWGRREIPTDSGGNSHNLFGIKAGSTWQGDTTDITTTEYVDGRPVKLVDRFRVYDSYADAFADYAKLIGSNPRYQDVVEASSPQQAARALQRGGYATDPRYAEKLGTLIAQMGSLESNHGAHLLADASSHEDRFAPDRMPTAIF